ncbi:hypothetical protein ATCC90586_003501 [Pythium insidiosum]|nr:hypothetical protein ATCC90586_003501 [Pythium insidiosum]
MPTTTTSMAMATAAPSPTPTPQGSSVREAFRLMSTLLFPSIPPAYLDRCARILQRRHLETVFEERAVQLLCAFPPCANRLRESSAKYRISLAKHEIYDAQSEKQFCSEQCLKKARVYLARLATKPPQLVPSLLDVFGTDRPNPHTFEEPETTSSTSARGHAAAQRARTIWAKTDDLGVVERKPPSLVNEVTVPSDLASSDAAITEHASPAAPAQEFPDAAQAVLIEGFVFPAHKSSLAKKVERGWQDADARRDDDIVVSDSEESTGFDDDDDASSTSSVVMSDFADDDEEEELVSSDDLPLFINLWRMFSAWATHNTNLVVAGRAPQDIDGQAAKPKAKETADEKKARENAARAALLVFNERLNAFSMMLSRHLPTVSRQLSLLCDRHVNQRLDTIVKTLEFRDAIDGRNSHQWSCIAAVLLLVAHEKRVESLSEAQKSALTATTKLDLQEIAQLLQLFYALRDDSEISSM